jgi:cytoskeletal protein RodZ
VATIGETFKDARDRKGVSPSEAAKATRMKVQHIEAMERDDFSGMAAPAYAKGFIKLYAEYLELDPAPLVQEYLSRHVTRERAPLMGEPEQSGGGIDVVAAARRFGKALAGVRREIWIRMGMLAAVVLVLLFVLRVWSSREPSAEGEGGGGSPASVQESAEPSAPLEIIEEPPEPYIDVNE